MRSRVPELCRRLRMASSCVRLSGTSRINTTCRRPAIVVVMTVVALLRALPVHGAAAAKCASSSSSAPALDCNRGEVQEACALRGLSISWKCYCANQVARECSDACRGDSENSLCTSSCQDYMRREQNLCELSDSEHRLSDGSVAGIVIGGVIGVALLIGASTLTVYKRRATTAGQSLSIQDYLKFLRLGCEKDPISPTEQDNPFPGNPLDANVGVGNNYNSAMIPLRTELLDEPNDRDNIA